MNTFNRFIILLALASFFSSCESRQTSSKPASTNPSSSNAAPKIDPPSTVVDRSPRVLSAIEGKKPTHKIIVKGAFQATATRIADESQTTIAPGAMAALRTEQAVIISRLLERLGVVPGLEGSTNPVLTIDLGVSKTDGLALSVESGAKTATRRIPPTDLPPELVSNFEHTLEAAIREVID